ncbi:MAG TPA: histidine kinase [Myxococcales bacterium]|nr:histidine kinase [Myxococcales bacterium]
MAAPPPAQPSVIRDTLRALLVPSRLLPILLVAVPLIAAQGIFSNDLLAVPLAVVLAAVFVVLAPLSWRILFPEDRQTGQVAIRLLLYAGEGAGVVLTVGAAVPKILGMGATFLTHRISLAISGALFLVGGWGLGRDIGMEASLQRARARAAALEREAEQAHLLALRAHLDPHFLFNTLNAIAEWCRQDGEVAERAVLQLSSILRAVLQGVRLAHWPLERELELVRALFSLHQLRNPAAFTVEWNVPEEVHRTPVPPLLLLPLAENAVKHGPASGHPGPITFSARPEGQTVHFRFENQGPYAGPRAGSDGIPTVERRLALAYGGGARLAITGDESSPSTAVEISVPAGGPQPGVMV